MNDPEQDPTELSQIPYVGGPLHDVMLYRHNVRPNSQWPPEVWSCFKSIPKGHPIGLYKLHENRLQWHTVHPVTLKD